MVYFSLLKCRPETLNITGKGPFRLRREVAAFVEPPSDKGLE